MFADISLMNILKEKYFGEFEKWDGHHSEVRAINICGEDPVIIVDLLNKDTKLVSSFRINPETDEILVSSFRINPKTDEIKVN